MQTLIVLTNSALSLQDLIGEIPGVFETRPIDESGYVAERDRLDGTTASMRVWVLGDPLSQYEEDDELPIKIGPETKGFLIEFNDLALLTDIAPMLLNREDILVDDDHGNVVSGVNFVEGLQKSKLLTWLPKDYST